MALPDNPEILWANTRKGKTQTHSRTTLHLFCRHAGKAPVELLKLQEQAMTSNDLDARYVVWDLVKAWISDFEGLKSTKLNYISTVKRFFAYWHRPLPDDDTWIRGLKSDRETPEAQLTPETFTTFLAACHGDLRMTSMMLVMLQSFSGPRELCIIGNTMGLKIADELKKGSNLIELYFSQGRKHSANPWYTFIGKDACESLREWFKERGWPTEGNPWIWPAQPSYHNPKGGGPLTTSGATQTFSRKAASLKFRPPVGTGERYDRYGISLGQIRDLAASLAQRVEGKQNDLSEIYTEATTNYFQGHTLDKLKYRKLHKLDPQYRKRMYQMAEPVLSPTTNPSFLVTGELIATQKRMQSLEKQIESRDKELKSFYERELLDDEEYLRQVEDHEIAMSEDERTRQIEKTKQNIENMRKLIASLG